MLFRPFESCNFAVAALPASRSPEEGSQGNRHSYQIPFTIQNNRTARTRCHRLKCIIATMLNATQTAPATFSTILALCGRSSE